ncbi:hypothetical protein QQS21_000816 [Conoideocrella luteorostrata]|uniref:Uncharacterized protein n=1 Tax=Conoideocrella luteorostrata TaxID=1105319 RepID=A0AAJ0D198_9HYPO|nr:hypothetical protein QQS21_000816 [Conoideocrella luteorostrata]
MARTASPVAPSREPNPSTTATGARGDAEDTAADAQSTASSTDHINEKASGPPLTKRQKVRRHCGRFWLWYLIATIIFLAIFLPILFKVIIPAIVQAIIKGQDLPIEGGRLDCVSSTEAKLGLNTSLNTPLPARLGNLTLDLYNKDTPTYSPFLNLTITGQQIKGDTKIVVVPQLVTVKNESELVSWLGKVFETDKVDLTVKGSPTVYLGELKSDAKLDKTIQLPGLRKFAGFGIKDLTLMVPPDKDGNNLKGTINIPNWGVLQLNLGNITFSLFSGKVQIGQITAREVLLNVGNNTLNFDGKLDLPGLVKNLGPVIHSQKDALNRGQVELNVTGNMVVVNGQRISYIEKVLGSRQLTTSMSVITLLSDVVNGFIGGGSNSIIDVFGDVIGNNTFLQHVIDHYNTTQINKNNTKSSAFTKRAPSPRDALMLNMLKMGLRMKLNQIQS